METTHSSQSRRGLLRRICNYGGILLRESFGLWLLRLLTDWWPECDVCQRIRGWMARPLFGSCGKGLRMGSHVTVIYPRRLHLGRDVMLVTSTWIDSIGGVWIADEVLVAPGCVITSTSHTYRDNSASRGPLALAETRIGRGTWLAAHVVVKAGVTIGSGVLVGANAVVTKDIPDNVIAGGVPAKVIGPRKDLQA